MKLFSCLILILILQSVNAQSSYTDNSDPEAIKILDVIHEDYNRYDAHKIDFDIIIELPGQGKEVQQGSLIQAGEKFVLDMPEQHIISDNTTAWVHLKSINEVQINDANFDEDDEFLSPSNLMKLHHSDKYIFALFNKFSENGVQVTQIECKPIDSDSEFSKIRLTINEKTKFLVRVKVFSKDGSRYTMNINNHKKNYSVNAKTFSFDENNYKGAMIEDLRF